MNYRKFSFKALEDGEEVTIGYTYVRCHMIFDVKMVYCRQKARLVAGEHMTDTPATMTYTRVVSRETVCLALVVSELTDLEVKCRDVMNAYITAPIKKNCGRLLGLNLSMTLEIGR